MLLASLTSAIIPGALRATHGLSNVVENAASVIGQLVATPTSETPRSISPTLSQTKPDDAQTASLKQAIQSGLKSAGLSLNGPLTLKDDGIGGIAIDSDSPDRFEIEQWINQQPELIEQFKSLSKQAGNANFRLTLIPASAEQRIDSLA